MSATPTVTGLEQRLFERAEKKLRSVLKDPLNKHLASLQFSQLVDLVGECRNWQLNSIYQVEAVRECLFKKHIGEYVQVETDLFLAEIDRLKSEVGNLHERIDEVIQ